MRQQSFIGKLAVTVIAIVALVYFGYHMYNVSGGQIETIDAVSVTAVDKINLTGVFIREQYPIEWQSQDMSEFLIDDGEKVASGQRVALLFSDSESRQQYAKYKELSSKLEALEESEAYLFDVADSAKLSLLIKSAVSDYTDAQIGGDISKISDATYQLNSLIDLQKNNISTKEEYETELSTLRNEVKAYSNASYSGSYLKSPTAGYFFKSSDGFDERYMPKNLDNLTCGDIRAAVDNAGNTLNYATGKVVAGFEWYFAAEIDESQVKKLKSVGSVKIAFPQVSTATEPAELIEIRTQDDGKSLAIFKSTHMNEQLLMSRVQQAEIILGNYTGIKIPKTSIRQNGGVWGVYCLVGEDKVFKEIKWVYETDSYYIVKQAKSVEEGLFEYDKIIISAI